MTASTEAVTVALTLPEFLAIGEQIGRLRARVAFLEYRLSALTDDATPERNTERQEV